MLDALSAEALKMRHHRGTWLMVWIYPIGMTLILAGVLIYNVVSGSVESEAADTTAAWIRDTTMLWHAPGSGPGRVLVAGFAALLFAGESNWNTWKLVIPARSRWHLIAAKWAVAIGFVFVALLMANLIVLAGEWLRSLQGAAIPTGVTTGAVIEAHIRAAAYSLLPIAYAVSFAGLVALLTGSILATVIASIALVFLEGLLGIIGVFFYANAPGLTRFLIEFLPPYHMSNMTSWAFEGAGLILPLGVDAAISLPWATSLSAMIAWIAAASAASLFSFMKKDIN